MKRFLAYGLILSFVILWLPKELLHDCDHNKENNFSKVQVDKKCYACDYDIHTLPNAEIQIGYNFVSQPIIQFEIPQIESVEITVNVSYLRGPPNA